MFFHFSLTNMQSGHRRRMQNGSAHFWMQNVGRRWCTTHVLESQRQQSSRAWAFDGHLHLWRTRCRAVCGFACNAFPRQILTTCYSVPWQNQCRLSVDSVSSCPICRQSPPVQFSGYDCLKNALLAQSGMALNPSLEEAHIQLLSKWNRLGTVRKSINIHDFVLDFLDFQWKLNWFGRFLLPALEVKLWGLDQWGELGHHHAASPDESTACHVLPSHHFRWQLDSLTANQKNLRWRFHEVS